jgi:hypothetical protein
VVPLRCNLSRALRLPRALGVNTTVAVQLLPGAKFRLQVLVVMMKSELFGPKMPAWMKGKLVVVLRFVKVTVWGWLLVPTC